MNSSKTAKSFQAKQYQVTLLTNKRKERMPHITQDPMSVLQSGVDFDARVIYITGQIDDSTSHRLLIALELLARNPEPIRIVMASCGGSVPDGYAIYDAIKLCPCVVLIDILGACQSIAALILQAGDVRRMSPEARFMVHNGSVEFAGAAHSDTLHAVGKEVKRESERYAQILAERSGLRLEVVRKYCMAETYFSAEEAIQCGFADLLIEPEPKKVPAKKRKRK